MEGFNETEQLGGASDLREDLEETLTTDKVEGFGEIDEGNIQRHVLFLALLLKLTDGEDHVNCRSFCTEATLGLWIDAVRKFL